jgi:hypothetical protein
VTFTSELGWKTSLFGSVGRFHVSGLRSPSLQSKERRERFFFVFKDGVSKKREGSFLRMQLGYFGRVNKTPCVCRASNEFVIIIRKTESLAAFERESLFEFSTFRQDLRFIDEEGRCTHI